MRLSKDSEKKWRTKSPSCRSERKFVLAAAKQDFPLQQYEYVSPADDVSNRDTPRGDQRTCHLKRNRVQAEVSGKQRVAVVIEHVRVQ